MARAYGVGDGINPIGLRARRRAAGPDARDPIPARARLRRMQQIRRRDLRAASGELGAFYIFPPKAKTAVAGLFSTRPSLEARIEGLQRLESQLRGTA
jgi:hypothetical protein